MRIRSSQDQRLTLKRVVVISSSLVVLLSLGLILLINLGDYRIAYAAAVTGDYKSVASGNWSSTAVWQKYNGTAWVAATAAPNSTNNIITIQSGHTVTVAANVTVDQVLISSGGSVVVNSGITMSIADGTGTDLDVSGTIKNAGIITPTGAAVINYNNGGKYQHNFTSSAGIVPAATWATGSICEIIGFTSSSSVPTGLGQSFSNFTWNCPSQTKDLDLNGTLSTVAGDLTIAATGAKELRWANSATTMTIGDDLIITGGNFVVNRNNSTTTLNIGGDFNQSGGDFAVLNATNPTMTMNVAGDFKLTSGIFEGVSGNNETGTVNVSGNMTHSGGTIETNANSATVLTFKFNGTSTQTYTGTGQTVNDNIDYNVMNGAVLDLGTSTIKGRNFTVTSGGQLIVGSSAGFGNIQVTGTKTFNSGSDYYFKSTSAQVTGSSFPSTIRNLTLDNSVDLTLTNDLTISGTLTFINGDIKTGSNILTITNSSPSAISGQSLNSWVVGNLKRTVAGTGSYAFPVGTAAYPEFVTIDLASVVGPTSLQVKFTNSSPATVLSTLSGVLVDGLTIDKVLTYGYWSATPNLPIISGKYTISVNERGYSSSVNSGCSYTLLNRISGILPWASVGTHDSHTQTVSGGTVTAVRSNMTSFGDFSIGYGEFLSMKNETLVSGVDGQVGALYRFPDVCSNVDMMVSLLELAGGATLEDIDHYSAGYDEGWQPFINAPPNTTSSILWKLSFKVADTNRDTILPWLAITGIDIDGDGGSLKEFVEATMPYSYDLAPGSLLTISKNNGNYRATSTFANVLDIDTSKYLAMFQINYKNVNSFYYRTGSISSYSGSQVRQNSLYFKSFFTGNQALPIKLTNFECKQRDSEVKLEWSTASEINNKTFTIERSADGEDFEAIHSQRGAGNSTSTLFYNDFDENPLDGNSFYRLKQTDYDGKFTYSEIKSVHFDRKKADVSRAIEIKTVAPNPFSETMSISFNSEASGTMNVSLLNSAGQIMSQDKVEVGDGYNNYQFPDLSRLTPGMYFAILSIGDTKVVQKVIKK